MMSSDQSSHTEHAPGAQLRAFAESYGVQILPGSGGLHDAILDSGEWPDDVLSVVSTVTYANSAMSSQWKLVTSSNADLIQGLCRRLRRREKDGSIVCWGAFGDITSGFVRRREAQMTSVAWFVLDVDGGTPLSNAIEAIRRSGLAAVVASTHSSTPEWHKYRCYFPLAEALKLVSLGGSLAAQKVHFKVARQLTLDLLGITHDPSDDNLAQAHYLPASRPDAPYVTVVIPGRAIVVPPLAVLEVEAAKLGLVKRHGTVGNATVRRGIASDDPDLQSLRREVGSFLSLHSDRFDVIAALEGADWEMRRHHGPDKATIACPNDAEHSNPNDPSDGGCVAFNPEGSMNEHAALTCRHAHCQELGSVVSVNVVEIGCN